MADFPNPQRLPPWLKVKLTGDGRYYEVRKRLGALKLHTVCEEARCPNMAECWAGGTATFMILGAVCTRGCRFCDVTSGRPPAPPDPSEPANLAEAVARSGLSYVVITSVDRDDLDDGGSQHFVDVVRALKALGDDPRRGDAGAPMVELLTPDFQGRDDQITRVADSGAEVLAHNVETVARLQRSMRDARCGYEQSLAVLAAYRAHDPRLLVKSSLMLGFGEQPHEVEQTLRDLRAVGVDWVTIGQYLRPTRKHAPVQQFVPPEQFDAYADYGRALGFSIVNSGPLTRSSYRAGEQDAERLVHERRVAMDALLDAAAAPLSF